MFRSESERVRHIRRMIRHTADMEEKSKLNKIADDLAQRELVPPPPAKKSSPEEPLLWPS